MALVQIDGENITVTDTAIGPSSGKVTGDIESAVFHHVSGGDINGQTKVTPVAAGAAGDSPHFLGNRWRIWGNDEIKNYKMVRQGSVNATIAVQYFGIGRS